MVVQDEREPGVVMYMCNVLDPMAQKIPEQELPPQMDPKPKMAAAYDTSPSLLRNPPPIPAETARPSVPDMAQLCAMLAGVPAAMQQMKGEIMQTMDTNACNFMDRMDARTQAFKSDMRAMRGEMRQVGQCLQVGTRGGDERAGGECTSG